MYKKYIIYMIWLILVVIWNFTFPNVKPIYDVLAAVILSDIANRLKNYLSPISFKRSSK